MDTKHEIPDGPPLDVGYYRPPWADPTFIMQTCYYKYSVITLSAGGTQALLKGDSRRIAITFSPGGLSSGNANFFPDGGDSAHPYTALASNTSKTLTLFVDGPVVCAAWNVNIVGMSTCGVYEILIY